MHLTSCRNSTLPPSSPPFALSVTLGLIAQQRSSLNPSHAKLLLALCLRLLSATLVTHVQAMLPQLACRPQVDQTPLQPKNQPCNTSDIPSRARLAKPDLAASSPPACEPAYAYLVLREPLPTRFYHESMLCCRCLCYRRLCRRRQLQPPPPFHLSLLSRSRSLPKSLEREFSLFLSNLSTTVSFPLFLSRKRALPSISPYFLSFINLFKKRRADESTHVKPPTLLACQLHRPHLI